MGGIPVALTMAWVVWGEAYLSRSDPRLAGVLIVEGWVGREALRDVGGEHRVGGYHRVVTTGGWSGESWSDRRWDYGEAARKELVRVGIPERVVVAAEPYEASTQRTYRSALAAREALMAHGWRPRAVNVFTRGAHARRSQLVYRKVFQGVCDVGVVGWCPPGDEASGWWSSSRRSREFLEETVGYWYEWVLSSGRWWSDAGTSGTAADAGRHDSDRGGGARDGKPAHGG